MASIQLLKAVHFLGILFIFQSIGALFFFNKSQASNRKLIFATHGVGLLLVLVSGLGMIGMVHPSLSWLALKALVWMGLGAVVSLILRNPEKRSPLWWGVLMLGLVGISVALLMNGVTAQPL